MSTRATLRKRYNGSAVTFPARRACCPQMAMTLLRIDSRARESAVSRQLTSGSVRAWRTHVRDGIVIKRDLARTALPPMTSQLAELHAADVIVIGAPMYNLSISRAHTDFQEPYLREILRSLGLVHVTFVHAEHQAQPALAEQSRAAAFECLVQLVTRLTQEVLADGPADGN
jgi:FMN-dependent NADH-azoreductase